MTSLFPFAPAFLDLAGRAVVLLGDHPAFPDLARRFVDCGASVTQIDPAPGVGALTIGPGVRVLARRWRSADLKGAALCVAAGGDRRTLRARQAAKASKAVFASLSAPGLSDVVFGVTLTLGRLAIGVDDRGLDPALAGLVRTRIEAALPPAVKALLAAAVALQPDVNARLSSAEERETFWRRAERIAFSEDSPQTPEEWGIWLRIQLQSADQLDPGASAAATL